MGPFEAVGFVHPEPRQGAALARNFVVETGQLLFLLQQQPPPLEPFLPGDCRPWCHGSFLPAQRIPGEDTNTSAQAQASTEPR